MLTSYGDVAAMPAKIKANAEYQHDPANPAEPQLVADAVANLVEMTERRPLRTVVMPAGLDFGVAQINEAVAPIQNGILTAMGMENMI